MKPYRELWWPRFWPFLRVVDELPATKRGRRKASNYGVSIVIRRDVLRDEPWVLQQEVYESRYWLRHPWRLVDFFWFYAMKPRQWFDGEFVMSDVLDWRYKRWKKADAHLASVECRSRAHEIRARLYGLGVNFDRSQRTAEFWAREYAITIYRARSWVPAGWTEERVYQEIVTNL